MSIHNLSVPAMVSISNAWVAPSKERPVFESYPLLTSILPSVDKVHTGLITIQVKSSSVAETLRELTEEALSLDLRHDRKLRGVFTMLSALAEIADDEAERAKLLSLRDRLIPDGLSGTQATYIDEAGEVSLAEGRLTDASKAYLRSIPIPGGSLADVVADWFAAGRSLGDVERRRAQLSAEKKKEAVSLSDVSKARGAWVRVANTVLQLIELTPEISEEHLNRIVQPLRTVEEKMDQRRRQAKEDEAEPETGDLDDAPVATDDEVVDASNSDLEAADS